MFARLWLNFSTFIWVVLVYVLNNTNSKGFSYWWAIGIFIAALVVGFFLLFWIEHSSKVSKHEQNPIAIQKIYPIHSEQIPAFFAICVVAFSMKSYENYDCIVFLFITIFLFILFMLHNVSYLNPIWYILSYRVYRVESLGTNYIFIMKKGIYNDLYNKENKIFKIFRTEIDQHTWFIQEIKEAEQKGKRC